MPIWFRSLGNWFIGEIWKGLEIGAREILESCKQSLVHDSGQSSEDENADRTPTVKAKEKHSTGSWTGNYMWCTWAENPSFVYMLGLFRRLRLKKVDEISCSSMFRV